MEQLVEELNRASAAYYNGLQELMRCRRNSFLNTKKSLVEDGQHYRKWVA